MADTGKNRLPSLRPSGMFQDFHKEMDQLLQSFFGREAPVPAAYEGLPQGLLSPAIDVTENDKEIRLTAELPGLAEEDVDLTIREGRLSLRGEKKIERDEDKDDVHITERRYGSFHRNLPIPARVDASEIEAKFDKGVLVVKMPKKPEAQAEERKVKIKK